MADSDIENSMKSLESTCEHSSRLSSTRALLDMLWYNQWANIAEILICGGLLKEYNHLRAGLD